MCWQLWLEFSQPTKDGEKVGTLFHTRLTLPKSGISRFFLLLINCDMSSLLHLSSPIISLHCFDLTAVHAHSGHLQVSTSTRPAFSVWEWLLIAVAWNHHDRLTEKWMVAAESDRKVGIPSYVSF